MNVGSVAGKLVVPGMVVYNASKFAAVGLSAAVREEHRGSGVSVSAVRTRLASGMRLKRRLIGDRRALTSVQRDVRAAYEATIAAQASGR